jgi:uncharacterized protein
MKFGLKDYMIEAIHGVFERYPDVERVFVYGSRAKGNFRPASDIDLTMVGEGLTLGTQYRIEEELDDLLLPHMIDLSILSRITNSDLLAHIERVGQVFFEKKPSLATPPPA